MTEMHVLVCSPTSNAGDIIPGSERHTAYCGHEVWVAPTSQATIAKFTATEMIVLCGKCAAAMMSVQAVAGIPIEVKPLTAAQRAEIADVLMTRRRRA